MTEINRTLSRNHAGTSITWATIVFIFVIVWALPAFGVESGRPPSESTRTPASGVSIHATAELLGVRVLEHVSYDRSRASCFAQTGWRNNDFTVSPILMEKPAAELRKPRYLHAAEKGLLKDYSRFGAASPGPAFSLLLSISVRSPARPYGDSGFQGRIALSHDGNFNDEDDWGAFPVTIAILDAFGVKDKLVHIEYNNILQANDPRFEKEMSASVLGAAEQYGVPATILHNCRTDLTGTIESIKSAVNASSCANPLYYLLAGPMDVPYRGLLAADPAKRRYVYCISHSSWNDGYGKRRIEGRNKRDLIALGVKWIQVGQGDRLAYPGTPGTKSTPAQWALFHWMRDARDVRLHWLFTRLEAEERCDVSDATMAYFLLTGDEQCDPKKLAALLDKKQRPSPIAIRPTIRLEAENFRLLENCAPVTIGKQASQSVAVRMAGASRSLMRTEFHEIHAARSGRYDVAIRYREGRGGASLTLQLRINGVPRGDAWNAEANDNGWKSHTVTQVLLCQGDEIEVVGRVPVRASGENASRHHYGPAEIDFVQLTYRGLDDPAALPG